MGAGSRRPGETVPGAAASRGAAEPRAARGGPARAIGEVLPATLRGMGVPSRAQARRFDAAWSDACADLEHRAWAAQSGPVSFQRGTLVVAVTSAPLRDQLANFYAERLLGALQKRLLSDRVIAVRFVAAGEDPK